ncbi:MAG: hypothetical protein Alpg2KO_04060 [Alphaproteobacteria bacterium]
MRLSEEEQLRHYFLSVLAGLVTVGLCFWVGELWVANGVEPNLFHDSLKSGWSMLILHFLAVPILMVGLARGISAAAIASAIATLGVLVISSRTLGLGGVFLLWLLHLGPAMFLLWQGLRFAKSGKDSAPEFYPLGRIMEQLCLFFVVLFALLAFSAVGFADGLRSMMTNWLQTTAFTPIAMTDIVTLVQPDADAAQALEGGRTMSLLLSAIFGQLLIGIIAMQVLVLLMLQGAISHSSLLRGGKSPLRPQMSIMDLRFSRITDGTWLLCSLILVVVAQQFGTVMTDPNADGSGILPGWIIFIVFNIAAIIFVLPFVAGVDLVFKLTAKRKWGWGIPIRIIFIGVLLFGVPAWLLIGGLGSIDVFAGWRDRQVARLAKLEKTND